MEPWREELAILNARLAVQQMALRALVHSHPNPAIVLEEWQKLRADTIAAAYAPQSDVRITEWLTEHVQALATEWMAELAFAATRQTAREKPA